MNLNFLLTFTNKIIIFLSVVLVAGIANFIIKFHKSDYYKNTDYGLLNTYLDKGRYGEYSIYYYLKEKAKGLFLFNLLIPFGNKFAEIDEVLIHESGIYVIESKNFGGTVTGDEDDKYWKGVSVNGKRFEFQNPIDQNNTHIVALKKFLNYKSAYQSFVVFSNRCVLNIRLSKTDAFVVNLSSIMKPLDNCFKKSRPKLNEREIQSIYNQLLKRSGKNVPPEERQEHEDNINRKYRGLA